MLQHQAESDRLVVTPDGVGVHGVEGGGMVVAFKITQDRAENAMLIGLREKLSRRRGVERALWLRSCRTQRIGEVD
jgi:hypothetical protein